MLREKLVACNSSFSAHKLRDIEEQATISPGVRPFSVVDILLQLFSFYYTSLDPNVNSVLNCRLRSRGNDTFLVASVCVRACVCPSVCLWVLSCLNNLIFSEQVDIRTQLAEFSQW